MYCVVNLASILLQEWTINTPTKIPIIDPIRVSTLTSKKPSHKNKEIPILFDKQKQCTNEMEEMFQPNK